MATKLGWVRRGFRPCAVALNVRIPALIWLAFPFVAACAARGDVTYTITDLGSGVATAINNFGQVIGSSTEPGSGYRYSDGTFMNLPFAPSAINGYGTVVGGSDGQALEYDSGTSTIFNLTAMSGGQFTQAFAVNDSNIIGGTNNLGLAAICWGSTGIVTDLGTKDLLGAGVSWGTSSRVNSLNASGQAVGPLRNYEVPGASFLYDPTSRKASAFGTGLTANAINNSGQVVGGGIDNLGAFVYSNGALTALRLPPSTVFSTATGINDSGLIVGSSAQSNTGPLIAFSYASGKFVDLNTLIASNSGWQLQQASGVNNNGQIVGYGEYGGSVHGFLLNPHPGVVPTPFRPHDGFLTPDGTVHSGANIAVVVTHGWEEELASGPPTQQVDWAASMAQSIANTTNANAFTWTWPDAFALTPFLLDSEARAEGDQLGSALKNAGVTQVHLIGHSLGSHVNAYAEEWLKQNAPNIKVLQETILDRPFPLSSSESFLLNQNVSDLQASGGWIDNYYGTGLTAVGAPMNGPASTVYNQAVDAGHSGVHDWYANTIAPSSTQGFFWSVEGGGASQRPTNTGATATSYYSTPIVTGGQPFYATVGSSIVGTRATLRLSPVPVLSNGNKSQLEAAATDPPADVETGQFWTDLTIPNDAVFLSFDLFFSNNDNADYLTLQFGSNLLFTYPASSFSSGGFESSGPIAVDGFNGQTDQLLFTLHSQGGTSTEVSIDNLSFLSPAPEPTGLLLMASGVLALLLRRPRLRRGP